MKWSHSCILNDHRLKKKIQRTKNKKNSWNQISEPQKCKHSLKLLLFHIIQQQHYSLDSIHILFIQFYVV